MEKQNIKEYLLDLATECILHSQKADQTMAWNLKSHYLIQAFFCTKKLQELYFFKYQNQYIQSFYLKFHYFHEKCALSMFTSKSSQELKELKDIHSELKNDLNRV